MLIPPAANVTAFALGLACATSALAQQGSPIVHDAEYYVLARQNGERWAADDRAVDARLAEFRRRNGGNPPNILYILIDDVGFGELGSPVLNHVRGYKTPRINEFAVQSMRFARMYTEPSCTPTRVAFITGRQPYRNGMAETAVAISGFGLAAEEVTLAELLKQAGYSTQAFVSNLYLDDRFGLGQGFDSNIHHEESAKPLTDRVIAWIETSQETPVFLFMSRLWIWETTGSRHRSYQESNTPSQHNASKTIFAAC